MDKSAANEKRDNFVARLFPKNPVLVIVKGQKC